MIVLTVISAFGDYPRGAQITDAEEVQKILDSDQHERVVKSEVPDPPKDEPAAAAEHEETPAA